MDSVTLARAAVEAAAIPAPSVETNPRITTDDGVEGAAVVGVDTWVWAASGTPSHVEVRATAGSTSVSVSADAGGLSLSAPGARTRCTGWGEPWFLADDLGRKEVLGTVGELVLAVDRLAFGQVGLDGVEQRLDALPIAGADRHDGSQAGMGLMDLGDQRQHFVDVAQLVDLVKRNDDRRVALEPRGRIRQRS